ncbi:unnamed protein product, partial [marine sediment metagenome]
MKLGDLLLSQGKHERSIAYYTRFREENPGSPLAEKAGYHLAYSLLKLGKLEDSLSTASELLDLFPQGNQRRQLMQLKIKVLSELNRVREARIAAEQCVNLYPEDIQARLDLIKLLFAEKDTKRVIREGTSLSTSFPEHEKEYPSLFLRGQFLLGLSSLIEGSNELALSALAAITPERTEKANLVWLLPYSRYYYGWALFRLKRFADAAKVLGSFILSYPDHPLKGNTLYLAGWCHFNQEEYSKAVSFFSRLSEEEDDLGLK